MVPTLIHQAKRRLEYIMKVKSNLKGIRLTSFIIEIILAFFGYTLFRNFSKSTCLVGLTITIIILVGLLRIFMAYGRTFLFDETGCTVIWGKYRKCYRWSELKAYEYQNRQNYVFFGKRNWEAPDVIVLFSSKEQKPRKPKWLGVEEYCLWFHPLSCIFVGYFRAEHESSPNSDEIYLVQKEELLAKLAEWNVEIHS